MSFIISTDSGSNMPMNYITENNLIVVPLTYIYDGVEHSTVNLDEFDGHAFYEMVKTKEVKTSTVNPDAFCKAWEPYLKAGHDILHISMSSGISGTYQSSLIAIDTILEDYPDRDIISIDTYCASLGEALNVFDAIDLRNEGKSLEETAKIIEERRHKIRQVFTVDDLMFLKRGGRLRTASAIVGTVLGIKPILKGNEKGQIVSDHNVRGRKSALKALVADYLEKVDDPDKYIASIAHTDCEEELEWVVDQIHNTYPNQKFVKAMYEPVTGCHVGPGTIALFFYQK